LDEAVNEHLLARRQLYDLLDEATQCEQFSGMWVRHAAYNWMIQDDTMSHNTGNLLVDGIGCSAVIVSESIIRPGNQQTMLYNADIRSKGNTATPRLYVMSENLMAVRRNPEYEGSRCFSKNV
jgi:hypothetical protein